MKVLFTNLLDTATLTAGGTSVNYPLTNLQHPFLKKKFQQTVAISGGSMSDADALTLTWTADKTIDFIAVGYTNAATLTLKLYDSSDTLIDTQTFTNAELGKSFAAVAGVRKVKLLMHDGSTDNPMTLYLGGLGIGQGYVMPDPFAEWEPGMLDNSFGDTTIDGQVSGQYVEPLRSLLFLFEVEEKETFDEIYNLIAALGKFTPVWIAPFENNLAYEKALYATLEFKAGRRSRRSFPFTITFQEAR